MGATTVTAPGTYVVTATTTANGCTATASVVITQDIAAPAITLSNNGPLTCTQTTVTLTPTCGWRGVYAAREGRIFFWYEL